MNKNAIIAICCVLSLPLALFGLLWQSGRYGRVEKEINQLKVQQESYYEQNRRLISQLAIYSSPEKISEIAENRLELEKDEERDVIRIVVVSDS